MATWASTREHVVLLPMARWMSALKAEVTLSLWGQPYEARTGAVLQWDLLHPSTEGQAVLVLLVLAQVRDALGGFVAGDVVVDPVAVAADLRPNASTTTRDLPPPPP